MRVVEDEVTTVRVVVVTGGRVVVVVVGWRWRTVSRQERPTQKPVQVMRMYLFITWHSGPGPLQFSSRVLFSH